MIIESSNITMRSESRRTERYERTESLTIFRAGEGQRDMLSISEQARQALNDISSQQALTMSGLETTYDIPERDQEQLSLLQVMLEALLGKKIRFYKFEPNMQTQGNDLRMPQIQFGIQYSRQESYIETERMTFASEGVIRTGDGREISFSVDLTMSRTFAEFHSFDFRAGAVNVLDPLVVNFDGNGVGLSEKKFSFDLTMDGSPDMISYLKQGSGFLALDLNNDGKINDGGELFGPATGNGFAELAQYDQDQNGWVDENDPIYDRLSIWVKDEDEEDQLFALGALGIGAIYLGNFVSKFDVKDENNQLHGQVSRTGIYLKEQGTVGTIQQIDMAL